MKKRLIDWLACPACGGGLSLESETREGDEIVGGHLACVGCRSVYPITSGVPRLLPQSLAADATVTAERFGYEWTRFAEIRPEYEAQFRDWIAPVQPDAFAGRVVLDAGCGKGRHLRLAASFGAREVIGVDLGPAVDVAARNTAHLPNVHVIQGDLTRPPLRRQSFDLIYSIGVLHHLSEPIAGFRGLAPLLTDDGMLVVWLYAREGNGWVLALVDPLRRVTRHLPLPFVSGLAWTFTLPLWAALRSLYQPSRRRPALAAMLPYRSYLSDMASLPFREVHSIVFDQLLPPVAHYMSQSHVARCFADAGLAMRGLRWHHANSWAAAGHRAAGAAESAEQ